jgi:hypothetical protein
MADPREKARGTEGRGLGITVKFMPSPSRGPQGVIIHGQKVWELEQDVLIVGKVKKDAARKTARSNQGLQSVKANKTLSSVQGRKPGNSKRPLPSVRAKLRPPSLQGLKSGKADQPQPLVQAKQQLPHEPIFEAGPGFEPIPWSEKLYDAERGIGLEMRLVEPKGTEIDEPKPSADEYFKGHAPSVETLAQVGGLIRALLYTFNLASLGSPEMVRRTEETADRLLPFAYAPEDVAPAKRYEQMWAMMFYEWLHVWQFAEAPEDISLVARRAAANLAVSEEAVAVAGAAARDQIVRPLKGISAGMRKMPDIKITFAESWGISEQVLERNPILGELAQARRVESFDAVSNIMGRFLKENDMETRLVPKKQMDELNPMSIEPGVLRIRDGLAQNPAKFAKELQHEMNAYYSSQYFRERGLGGSELLWTPKSEGPPGFGGYQNHVLDMMTNPTP